MWLSLYLLPHSHVMNAMLMQLPGCRVFHFIHTNVGHCLLAMPTWFNVATGVSATRQIDVRVITGDGWWNEAAKQHHCFHTHSGCSVVHATFRPNVECRAA